MRVRDLKRRDVLRTSGAFLAIAPMVTLTSMPVAARKMPHRAFPAGPFRLRRDLERGLGDGNAIVVSRIWECRLDSVGSGARVLGDQVSVDVEAPALLSQIADLEKRRRVTSFLPAELDSTGRIVRAGQGGQDGAPLASAVATATAIFEQLPSLVPSSEAKAFLSAIDRTAAGLVSRVPPDLFFPAEGENIESRAIELPNGETGQIVVEASVNTMPQTGLLRSSERRVITRVAGSERTSRESWNLTLT